MAGYFKENDPMNFANEIQRLFRSNYLNLEGNFVNGDIHAVVSRSQRARLSPAAAVVGIYALSKADVRRYSALFGQSKMSSHIPFFIGTALRWGRAACRPQRS